LNSGIVQDYLVILLSISSSNDYRKQIVMITCLRRSPAFDDTHKSCPNKGI